VIPHSPASPMRAPERPPAPASRDVPRPPARPGTVVGYALGLLALASFAVVALLAGGAALPPLGACLVLAVPLTLCMNRFVLFPNEVGATAEAAVIFTALVAFRNDSPVLGPLLLALLVGVLDARHWERRAFLRMTYNSGSQALTALVTALAFAPLADATGASDTGLVGACVLASILYVAAETLFGVVLVVLLGERWRAALRHQLPVNGLAVALALLGGAVGVVVGATAWWVGGVLLLPAAFVPELVLVGVRRPHARREVAFAATLTGFGCFALALDRLPAGRGLGAAVAVAGLAVLLAADARQPRRRSLPPVGALVLATAAALAPAPWVAATCVTGAAVALVVDGHPRHVSWAIPLLGAGAALALVARATPVPPGVLTLVGVVALLFAVATWGVLPWSSRVIGPWGSRRGRRGPVVVLVVASVTSVVAAAAWSVTGASLAGRVALATAATVLASATAAVRQWRFAPATRRRDGAVLAAAAVVLGGVGACGFVGATTPAAVGGIVVVGVADVVAFASTRAVRHRVTST
jgi:hypothetical protein